MSGGRGTKWGRINDYRKESNEESFVAVMCESLEGLKNIKEIAKVKGLDAIFIGAFDLSQALGVPGDVTNPIVEDAIAEIYDACIESSVIPGRVAPSLEMARKRIEQGFLYVTILDDMAFFADAVEKRLKDVKA